MNSEPAHNVFALPTRLDDFQFWRCRACGQQMGYHQPINFKLQLNLLEAFMSRHEHEHSVAARPLHYLPDAVKLADWPLCDTSNSEVYGRLEPFCHTYRRPPWDKFISVWPDSGEVALRQSNPDGRTYTTLFSGSVGDEREFDKLIAAFKFQVPDANP